MLAPVDVLLLRAALLDSGPAADAYAELRKSFDLDTLDYGRQRLLPMLHRNLVRLGIDDRDLGRLRGVRRYHWALNHVRVRALGPLLAAMRAAGVPTMVLKGAALVAAYLDDPSLRPMDDVDILVPRQHRAAAAEIMATHGFKPIAMSPRVDFAGVEEFVHGWPFVDGARVNVDLHWHVLYLDCRPHADDAFWRRARPAIFAGQPTLTLDPTDQLLNLIAHGAVWNDYATLRWAADATCVLRASAGEIDWNRLARDSIHRQIAPPMHDGLEALRTVLGIGVPSHALRSLRRASGPRARREFELRSAPLQDRKPEERELVAAMDYRRRRGWLMRLPLFAARLAYLRYQYGARNLWGLRALRRFERAGRPAWFRRHRLDEQAKVALPDDLPPVGTVLNSTAGGSVRRGYLDGWSYHEVEGRWTVRPEARFAWKLDPAAAQKLDLEIVGSAFCPPKAPFPCVAFWANGYLVGRWRADGKGGFRTPKRFRIPIEALADAEALVVTIVVDRPRAPADHGVSADTRPLGVFVRSALLAPRAERARRLAKSD
ncbi:MAG: nucleotidyltransferase family protein [Rhodospirillaceae bacterium]|nr:nucleotidyltransferase family protein [Rhodospirillaceae bacterium]